MAGADAIILPLNDFMGISAMGKICLGVDFVPCPASRPQGGKRSAALELAKTFFTGFCF
jgi:hypothetical protein